MHSLLITPASEAEFSLLVALLEKMRVRVRPMPYEECVAEPTFPYNQTEQALVDGIGELREIRAGKQSAQTLEDFWREVTSE